MEKNIFRPPRGKSGTEFIKELTPLLNLFVDKTKWERLALPLVHIFIPLMLQNARQKSKPGVHSKDLTSRLTKWKDGSLQSLMQEMVEIQKRLKRSKRSKKRVDAAQKAFVKLIFLGKLGVAARRINNLDSVKGVHQLNEEIKTYFRKNTQICYHQEPVLRRYLKQLLQRQCIRQQSR